MVNQIEHIRQLCRLYAANKASDEQVKELLSFLKEPANEATGRELFFQVIQRTEDSSANGKLPVDLDLAWEDILEASATLRGQWQKQPEVSNPLSGEGTPAMGGRTAHRVHFMRRWGWAAASLIVLSAGAYLFFKPAKKDPSVAQTTATPLEKDIMPGKEGAILTLADGQQIVLDSLGNGRVTQQSGVDVSLKDGQLAYDRGRVGGGTVMWNTMTTPRGRQFKVLLADGTKVWLNAASSITYPISFEGDSRQVRITGEAYFDVAQDAEKPFRVLVEPGMQIDVLGTQFNVNAYADEGAVATALIEGAVNVTVNRDTRKLAPGQLAEVVRQAGDAKQLKVVNNVSTESITAWKTGVFNFNNKSLESIMRQLSRWYDIEVIYAGKIPDKQFWGEMGMDLKLEDVLQFLEKSKVKFTYQKGRKLIVSP